MRIHAQISNRKLTTEQAKRYRKRKQRLRGQHKKQEILAKLVVEKAPTLTEHQFKELKKFGHVQTTVSGKKRRKILKAAKRNERDLNKMDAEIPSVETSKKNIRREKEDLQSSARMEIS